MLEKNNTIKNSGSKKISDEAATNIQYMHINLPSSQSLVFQQQDWPTLGHHYFLASQMVSCCWFCGHGRLVLEKAFLSVLASTLSMGFDQQGMIWCNFCPLDLVYSIMKLYMYIVPLYDVAEIKGKSVTDHQ